MYLQRESWEITSRSAFRGIAIESIKIPSTALYIGEYAFSECDNLEEIILEEGIKRIGDLAFAGAPIESITIPSTVEEIEKDIFRTNDKLKEINCKIKKSYYDTHQAQLYGLRASELNGRKINWLNGQHLSIFSNF